MLAHAQRDALGVPSQVPLDLARGLVAQVQAVEGELVQVGGELGGKDRAAVSARDRLRRARGGQIQVLGGHVKALGAAKNASRSGGQRRRSQVDGDQGGHGQGQRGGLGLDHAVALAHQRLAGTAIDAHARQDVAGLERGQRGLAFGIRGAGRQGLVSRTRAPGGHQMHHIADAPAGHELAVQRQAARGGQGAVARDVGHLQVQHRVGAGDHGHRAQHPGRAGCTAPGGCGRQRHQARGLVGQQQAFGARCFAAHVQGQRGHGLHPAFGAGPSHAHLRARPVLGVTQGVAVQREQQAAVGLEQVGLVDPGFLHGGPGEDWRRRHRGLCGRTGQGGETARGRGGKAVKVDRRVRRASRLAAAQHLPHLGHQGAIGHGLECGQRPRAGCRDRAAAATGAEGDHRASQAGHQPRREHQPPGSAGPSSGGHGLGVRWRFGGAVEGRAGRAHGDSSLRCRRCHRPHCASRNPYGGFLRWGQ